MRIIVFLIMFYSGVVMAQVTPAIPAGTVLGNTTLALAPPTATANPVVTSIIAPGNNVFPALAYGSCTWTTASNPTTDVGPCINLAIAAAAAAGGGTVTIPATGASVGFGVTTPIVQANNGVRIVGAGLQYGGSTGTTNLIATSSFSSTGTMFTLAAGSPGELSGVDVIGINFNCNNYAKYGFHATSVSSSTFEVGVAYCGGSGPGSPTAGSGAASGGAENGIFDAGTAGNGNQNNNFARLYTASNNYATGWRLDTGGSPGSKNTTNTSQDTVGEVFMAIKNGDGLVVGDVDNTYFYGPIRCQGGCKGNTAGTLGPGRPLVVSGGGASALTYKSPNGVQVNGSQQHPQVKIFHTSVPVAVVGYDSTYTTSAGANTGTEAITTVTLTPTTPYPSAGTDVITFTTNPINAGVVVGMVLQSCGNGEMDSAVPNNDPVIGVTSTTVQLLQPVIDLKTYGIENGSLSPNSCTFGMGIQPSASVGNTTPGVYSMCYNSSNATVCGGYTCASNSVGNPWCIGNSATVGQSGVAAVTHSSGPNTLTFADMVIPITTATPSNGDTFTINVPPPAANISVFGTDEGNAIALAQFEPGAQGNHGYETQLLPFSSSLQSYPGYLFCFSATIDCQAAYQTADFQGIGNPYPYVGIEGGVTSGSVGYGLHVQGYINDPTAVDGAVLYANITCLNGTGCASGTKLIDLKTNTASYVTSCHTGVSGCVTGSPAGTSVFSVDYQGNLVMAGVPSFTAGLTVSGGAINLDAAASTNYAVAINTGSNNTGAINIGAGSGGTATTQVVTIGNDSSASTGGYDTVNIGGVITLQQAGAKNVSIEGGASTGNTLINNGTGTGTVSIGNSAGTNTITGATSINAAASNNTNIETGAATGQVHINDGTGTGAVTLGNTTGPDIVNLTPTTIQLIGNRWISTTAPTIGSGFGTTASFSPAFKSTKAFVIQATGTGQTTTTILSAFAAAANQWICMAQDITTNITGRMSASSASAVTITWSAAPTANDYLAFQCDGI